MADKMPKKPGPFEKYGGKDGGSSDSGKSELGQFANWVYQKATSHPIGQIEETLQTGKPPVKQPEKELIPAPAPAANKQPAFRRYGPPAPQKMRR
jgi:hypothetical protein